MRKKEYLDNKKGISFRLIITWQQFPIQNKMNSPNTHVHCYIKIPLSMEFIKPNYIYIDAEYPEPETELLGTTILGNS